MSGRYLYCGNCGEYLGSLGGDDCRLCGWVAGRPREIFTSLLKGKP